MHDYHLHTSLCKHADGEMEEYVESAIENGVTEICFSDHIPLPNRFDTAHRMSLEHMETYQEKINILKRKYREITILFGIEADYIEGLEEYLEGFLAKYPFDLVIMGIHFIKRWPSHQWVFDFDYDRQTIRQRYKDYFNAMIKGIKTELFDVVGHLDLIKRPGLPVLASCAREVKQVVDTAYSKGMSIELNLSGLLKPIKDFYPSMEIVEMIVEKGVPIVMGSDAHTPEQVGMCFDELFNHLFNYSGLKMASYQRRRRTVNRLFQPDDQTFH